MINEKIQTTQSEQVVQVDTKNFLSLDLILDKIHKKQEELDDEDTTGHIYWGIFENFVRGLVQ